MPEIKIGDYLFQRIHQLGVRSVFGVPGDYELALLDLVTDNGLDWKGNPNELIASYAADGYARMKGAAAFVTTFGPGELSAYCGMAGHYCEFVPVCHIVGYPGVPAQKAHAIMHHSLGTGEFGMYEKMAEQITAATAVLKDQHTACDEIDKILTTMIIESRPVYVGLSVDVGYLMVSDEQLKTPLKIELPPNDSKIQAQVVEELRALIEKASSPAIIVDGNTVRNGCLKETRALIDALGFPTYVTAMGKGAVDEDIPSFAGFYAGAGSHPEVKKAVEDADLILWLGRYGSDFNTGEFTMSVKESGVVDFQRFWVKLRETKLDLKMKYLLAALAQSIKEKPLNTAKTNITWKPWDTSAPASGKLTQDFLWQELGKFFKTGDCIITETGTSAYGIVESKFPPGVIQFSQTVYGSIGYATGAAVGAFQGIKETGEYKRGVLITGEGSLQLTVQAIADMLRHNLKNVMFLLNNDGYTVERLIHGKDAAYNKVPIWDYSLLAKMFGPSFPSKYHGPIDTCEKLRELIADPSFGNGDAFELVELILEPLDAPLNVRLCGAAIDEFNKRKQ